MAKTTKKEKLSDEEILAEIKMLSQKAQETSSHQMDLGLGDIGDEDIDNDFNTSILSDLANPDDSHRLYYTMRTTMRNYLPQGKSNKKLREYIYSEKSLFLNRGVESLPNKPKGSDERMAYISNFLTVALNTVMEWVSSGSNPFELYTAFYNLNERHGFHKKS